MELIILIVYLVKESINAYFIFLVYGVDIHLFVYLYLYNVKYNFCN